MSSFRRRTIELLAALVLTGVGPAEEIRHAPNAAAAPVDQLAISGNACGPAALLASFRCGGPDWQRAAAALPGDDDRQRLRLWIRRHGLQPSATLKGRKRWTSAGINVEDLLLATNEMTRPLYLPPLAADDLFLRRGESPDALLRRTRDRFDRSLAKGIPPLLSLRRFVLRGGEWTAVQGHFVTVVSVPRKIPRGADSIPIDYLDPWGGKRCQGELAIARTSLLAPAGKAAPCLEARLPDANIGRREIRRGETTAIVPAAVIGRW